MQKPNFKFGDRVKVYDEIATVLSVHYNGCEVRFDKPNKYGFTDYFVFYKNLKKVEEKEMKYKVGQKVIDNTGQFFEKGIKARIVHVYNDPKAPPSYMVGDGIVSWYAREDELSPIFPVPKYRKYDRVNWFEGFSVYPSIIMDVRTVDGSPLYHIVTENQNRESDVLEDKLDRLPDKFEVNIHRDNNKTIAQFIRNGAEVMREEVTKCHPDDEDDFEIDSDIAYSRLMRFPEVSKAVKKENEKLKADLEQARADADYYAKQARDKSKILDDVLKSNEEISKGYEELSEKYNEMEEKVREYDGIRSNNADMINRNADLEEQLSKQKEINKELVDEHAELIRDYAHKSDLLAELEEQVDKQKEINKELVGENEKLKAEIEKLKACNKEIKVCDTVEIVNSKACYSLYEEWIDKYLPKFANQWNEFHDPKNGDIGIVMAKAKHYRSGEMLYAVLIGEKVYIMGERSIKLHNN